jgi:pyrroloquinoline-quinone synthase
VSALLSRDTFEAALRAIGAERYHSLHPFSVLLTEGRLNRGQLQAWALNRYYYQSRVPMKDAALLSQAEDPAFRRAWRQRLIDHDGTDDSGGGITRWLVLTGDLGLNEDDVRSTKGVLPATRFAVDAYVRFVRERPLLEAVASSLTEMFSPALMAERAAGMLAHYPFVTARTLTYFDKRQSEAPADSAFALDYVLGNADTADRQRAALDALTMKCDVLWAQLDALHHAYVAPGHVPPGAFRPEAA